MLGHYKSWQGLKKWLEDALCDELKGRVHYFLTRYVRVHNAYGRAAIELDGSMQVCFTWDRGYKQEADENRMYAAGMGGYDEILEKLKPEWDAACVYSEGDFLAAALEFRNLSIRKALNRKIISSECWRFWTGGWGGAPSGPFRMRGIMKTLRIG